MTNYILKTLLIVLLFLTSGFLKGAESIAGNKGPNPVFTTGAFLNVDENETFIETIVATPSDMGGAITYTITGGIHQSVFTLSPTGDLSFKSAQDSEALGSNNAFQVIIQADDGVATATEVFLVTVRDVDEFPISFKGNIHIGLDLQLCMGQEQDPLILFGTKFTKKVSRIPTQG